MDWNGVIERNREALTRIVLALAAMAGLSAHLSLVGRSAVVGSPGGGDAQANTPTRRFASTSPQGGGESGCGPDPRLTLPRHLHRAIVTLLRPAESAARRLIIIIARDLVVPPPRPAKPDAAQQMAQHHAALRRLGIAIVVPAAECARFAAMMKRRAAARQRPRILSLPLLDPLPKDPFRRRRKTVSNRNMPRILSLDWTDPRPLPPRPPLPSPDDPVDATRVALRLAALQRALDDLPRQALRFARWKAGRDAAAAQPRDPRSQSRRRSRFARFSPLRPGPAWGWRRPHSRRKPHEIDEVLADLHYFAFHTLERRDTS